MARERGDIEAKNGDGECALHAAATSGNKDMIACLLQHGADINMQTPDGATALILAASDGAVDAVPCLLASGARADFCIVGGKMAHDMVPKSKLRLRQILKLAAVRPSQVTPPFIQRACKSGVSATVEEWLDADGCTDAREPLSSQHHAHVGSKRVLYWAGRVAAKARGGHRCAERSRPDSAFVCGLHRRPFGRGAAASECKCTH
eukprot:6383992-Prymnesium_polylepis.1